MKDPYMCIVELNKHLLKWNEGDIVVIFLESGISYTLQLSFISRKSRGFSRKKVHSTVINLLHWALLVQTNSWIKHNLHLSSNRRWINQTVLYCNPRVMIPSRRLITDTGNNPGSPVNVCNQCQGVCMCSSSKQELTKPWLS